MTRRFALGFAIGLLIFLAVNLASAHFASDCGLMAVFGRDPCSDDIARAGWPLQFYEEGGFDYRRIFQGGFLVLDIVTGVIVAGTFGWIAARRMK